MDILELKNPEPKIKNSMEGLKRRLNKTEHRISKHTEMLQECISTETEKRLERSKPKRHDVELSQMV